MKFKFFQMSAGILVVGSLVVFPACKRKMAPEKWVREVRVKKVLKNHQASIMALAISPKGNLMASSDLNGKLILWDLEKAEPKKEVSFHDSQFLALAFSPQGNYLAAGGREKIVIIYDTLNMEVKTTSPGLPDLVMALAWKDNQTVASGSCKQLDPRGWCGGGEIDLWKVGAAVEELRSWDAHNEFINALAFSPNKRYLASGGSDRVILVWDPQTGKQVKSLSGHEQRVNVLAFSEADPDLLVSASLDGTTRLWNVAEGRELNLLDAQAGEVYGMAIHPDGKLIATGGREPKVIIWNAQTGEKLKEFSDLGGMISALSFSPDGKELAAGLDNGELVIFGP